MSGAHPRQLSRRGLAISLIGGLIATAGLLAWRTAGARQIPTPVDLSRLAPGHQLAGSYIQLDRHVRLFPLVVYAAEESLRNNPDGRLLYAYYPVVSTTDPYLLELDRLQDQFGTLANVPPKMLFGGTPAFLLLVRTKRFVRLADLPQRRLTYQSLRGQVRAGSLHEAEKQMVQQSYPKLDLQRVLVLEENTAPPDTTARALALAIGGVLLLLLGIGVIGADRIRV